MLNSEATADLRSSFRNWRFWLTFGAADAGAQFKRTSIGGFFHTLNYTLRIGLLYFLFRDSLGAHDPHYFAYLALGIPIFSLYSASISNGYSILRRNKPIIENIAMPYFAFIFRFLVEHSIRLGFALLPFVVYAALNPGMLAGAPHFILLGIVMMLMLVIVLSLFFMVISAFFPNLYAAINALMGIMFFATPVFWHPGDRTGLRGLLATYNPLSHMLAVVREPLAGRVPDTVSLAAVAAIIVLVGVVGWFLFQKSRSWLVYRV